MNDNGVMAWCAPLDKGHHHNTRVEVDDVGVGRREGKVLAGGWLLDQGKKVGAGLIGLRCHYNTGANLPVLVIANST